MTFDVCSSALVQDYDWWNCGTSPGDNGCKGDPSTGKVGAGQMMLKKRVLFKVLCSSRFFVFDAELWICRYLNHYLNH